MFRWILTISVSVCGVRTADVVADIPNNNAMGTKDTCRWLTSPRSNVARFSTLPGGGWDNLRNKDMGRVADISFKNCKLSDDGTYAIPSNVILLIRKESAVEVMSELMEHFNNYSSTVSSSINTEASSQYLGISGKLSDEFQQVKSVAVSSKLKIGRTQLRYRLYTAKLQPDFQLSKAFVNRMADIVNAIASNRTKLARYLSDLVVRDFGTHAITTVEAGGVLEKTDFVNTDVFKSREAMEKKLSASMSLSFFQLLKVSAGATFSATSENVEEYKKSVSKMSIRAHGGPILGADPSLEDWLKGLKENLVPVDRDGEPLHAVINRRSLPGMPVVFMLQLRKEIEGAVTRYYSANTVKGCQDPNSGNFDPVANVDGHCESPATNYSFAGVYQTCSETRPWLSACGGALMNPISGSLSCPQGYEDVPLLTTAGETRKKCTRRTKSCWVFFTCEDGESCEESTSTLRAFWCAARKGARLRPHSGMVFGGAYSTSGRFINEVTQAASCRDLFRPFIIGRDIVLCLSMDLQSAARYRLPFAGFFSCHSGNPLAEPNRGLVASSRGGFSSGASSESLKRCPDGFSQVTLDTVDGCAIMQCVKGRSGLSRLPVRRPPFEEPDYELIERPVTRVESHGWRWGYNVSSNAWSFLGFFGSDIKSAIGLMSAAKVSASSPSISIATPVIVVAGCIAGLIAGIVITALIVRSRGHSGSRIQHRVLGRIRSRRSDAPTEDDVRCRPPVGRSAQRVAYGTVETDELLACSFQGDEDQVDMNDEVVVSCRRAEVH